MDEIRYLLALQLNKAASTPKRYNLKILSDPKELTESKYISAYLNNREIKLTQKQYGMLYQLSYGNKYLSVKDSSIRTTIRRINKAFEKEFSGLQLLIPSNGRYCLSSSVNTVD